MYISVQRGALTLLVSIIWGNARAFTSWNEQQASAPRSFFVCQNHDNHIVWCGSSQRPIGMMEHATQHLVYFNSRDKLIRLDVQKVVYFESDGNYTYIVTSNKQKICITMNLSHTEEAMAAQLGKVAQQFMRIGKRFVVNMKYIYQIDMQKQVLLLSDWDKFVFQLPVSKEALKSVKKLIIQIKV
jgi:DNA-binding LytR/AlgR family response regulator